MTDFAVPDDFAALAERIDQADPGNGDQAGALAELAQVRTIIEDYKRQLTKLDAAAEERMRVGLRPGEKVNLGELGWWGRSKGRERTFTPDHKKALLRRVRNLARANEVTGEVLPPDEQLDRLVGHVEAGFTLSPRIQWFEATCPDVDLQDDDSDWCGWRPKDQKVGRLPG